jgi:hypothetical protein
MDQNCIVIPKVNNIFKNDMCKKLRLRALKSAILKFFDQLIEALTGGEIFFPQIKS